MDTMKKIYIVLAHTGTLLSRIIKMKTGAEYTHSSIALDENLDEMYSFGRKYSYWRVCKRRCVFWNI